MKGKVSFGFVTIVGLGGALTLTGSSKPRLTSHDKAYYLSQAQVKLIRPGLNLKIQRVALDSLPTVKVMFRISDDKNLDSTALALTHRDP